MLCCSVQLELVQEIYTGSYDIIGMQPHAYLGLEVLIIYSSLSPLTVAVEVKVSEVEVEDKDDI